MVSKDGNSPLAQLKNWVESRSLYLKGLALAGAVMLNVTATVAAAISAYYSSKQTELATEAVNLQSRNEAFAELVGAMKSLCAVSMTEWDQIDSALIAYSGERESPEVYFVRHVDIDEVVEATKDDLSEKVDRYITQAVQYRSVVWDKFDILQIWLGENRQQAIAEILPGFDDLTYTRDWLQGTKMPAAAVAVRNNYECRAIIRNMMAVYKSSEDDVPLMEHPQVLILPFSKSRSSEEILVSWGDERSLEILRENEFLIAPDRVIPPAGGAATE